MYSERKRDRIKWMKSETYYIISLIFFFCWHLNRGVFPLDIFINIFVCCVKRWKVEVRYLFNQDISLCLIIIISELMWMSKIIIWFFFCFVWLWWYLYKHGHLMLWSKIYHNQTLMFIYLCLFFVLWPRRNIFNRFQCQIMSFWVCRYIWIKRNGLCIYWNINEQSEEKELETREKKIT